MKTEKINGILGVVLKAVVIICALVITFFYWQKKDTGKYHYNRLDNRAEVFNTRTGEIIFMSDGKFLLINPVEKAKN